LNNASNINIGHRKDVFFQDLEKKSHFFGQDEQDRQDTILLQNPVHPVNPVERFRFLGFFNIYETHENRNPAHVLNVSPSCVFGDGSAPPSVRKFAVGIKQLICR